MLRSLCRLFSCLTFQPFDCLLPVAFGRFHSALYVRFREWLHALDYGVARLQVMHRLVGMIKGGWVRRLFCCCYFLRKGFTFFFLRLFVEPPYQTFFHQLAAVYRNDGYRERIPRVVKVKENGV